MLYPDRPVDRIPPSEFRPPHCPWSECPDHLVDPPRRYRFVRNGSYTRKCDRRRVPRFRCRRCRRGFSRQTFSVTYCMKRPELLDTVANWMVSGAALRPIARAYNGTHPHKPCHPSTVVRIARRIGSQAALLLEECRRQLPRIAEPIVFDHFETFVGMQENALGVLTPVGRRSWYTYGLEPAWHRRATAGSRRRPRVGSSPGQYRRSVARMLTGLVERMPAGQTLRLISDDHGEYPKAIAAARGRAQITHAAFPNPPERGRGQQRSAAARVRDRELFAVDLEHMWIRHVCADHRRESIAFCRRGEAAIERLAAFAVWRNLIQGVSERRNDPTTPAMKLGLTERPWTWRDVLARRRWPGRVGVGPTTETILRRALRDPRGIRWPEHVRRRAL